MKKYKCMSQVSQPSGKKRKKKKKTNQSQHHTPRSNGWRELFNSCPFTVTHGKGDASTSVSTWVKLFKYETFPSKSSTRPYRTANKLMPVMANTITEYSEMEGTHKDHTLCKKSFIKQTPGKKIQFGR